MKIHSYLEYLARQYGFVVLLMAMSATTALAQDNTPTSALEGTETAPSPPTSIFFEHLTTADGLSEGTTLAIVQDEQGFMWFATQYGLDRYDGYQVTVFTHDPDDPTSLSNNDIRALHLGQDGSLWVGTANGGLNRLDPTTGTFTHYQHNPDDPRSLSDNRVYALTLGQDGSVWAGTASGLCRFDNAADNFECYLNNPDDPRSISNNLILSLYSDSTGTIWAGTDQGLNALDPATGTLTRYMHNPDDPLSISSDSVHAIFEDRDGNLWLGTRIDGLNRFNRSLNTFTSYQNDPENPNSLSGNSVVSIFQDTSGILWVGTWAADINFIAPSQHKFASIFTVQGNPISIQADTDQLWVGTLEDGLFAIDLTTQHVRQFIHDSDDPHSLRDNSIFMLYLDKAGRLWAATAAGLSRYDPETRHFDYPFSEAAAAVGLDTAIIRTMVEDSRGQLWLGTQTGLFCLNPLTGTFDCYARDANAKLLDTNIPIYALAEDTAGMLWVGTLVGLYGLNPLTNQIEPYNSNTSGLSTNIVAILPDDDGLLWIGTWGSGLYHFDPSSGQTTHYIRKNGLPSDLITGINKDRQGRLWMSTSGGLALFNPKDEAVRTYDQLDGLPRIDFNQNAVFQSDAGAMYFGSSKHVIMFHPDDIIDNPYLPPVVLTGFQLFNKPVTIGSDSPLKQQPNYITNLTLNYDQSVFSFEYAALNFTAAARNQYAFKLEGFDTDWNEVGNRRMATYTNLKPGSYTFRVKASNNDGLWNENGLSIHLTITPPWWQTWWAYILYIMIGATIILGYIRYRTQAHARELAFQRLELAQERHLRETIERVDRSKDEERSRIAREMHDGLAQTLAGLRFRVRTWPKLITLSSSRMTTEINDVGVVLDETLQDLRRIIFALRPIMLSELGFLLSVRHLAESLSKHNSIEIHTTITGDETQLAEILEHAAFRIVQEALHNVLRHAHASQIWLTIAVETGMVDIEVRDNGVGFDTALLELRARQGHHGLVNLRERAAAFQGSVVISSRLEHGTTLHVRLPFEETDRVD